MEFAFETLRRAPDVEGPGLAAFDTADRLLLDESASARGTLDAGALAVIGDTHGALTLASADAGARGIRVHQDALTGERALARNAAALGLEDAFTSLPLGVELLRGAKVVLLRLPRSLDALDDMATMIAAHADPEVIVFAGGRLKHMAVSMNEVLRRRFARLDVTHARQKSRVLVARVPLPTPRAPLAPRSARIALPERGEHLPAEQIVLCAHGGVFAGATLDIGTRMLLAHLPADLPAGGPLVDFACGTGVVGTTLALRNPDRRVHASDVSAAACASARATAAANGVADRVTVAQDDLLHVLPDGSTGFVALNPPFHSGAAVTDAIAARMFADAARALRPGGELWTVWNSPLRYRAALERLVGPTRQVARDPKFTLTVSTRH
ncbi:methyltransferase [Microbacterium sp. SORGH_AS_0888]|uniref:class I SAM-dependent methyltransferase n=1 Tax=Microbacterium sp. SORGH_AS_0888 TaxID=3041791 RepID=UPI00278931B4|nr:methyltransferase [Microbacterium sp. SORGH_AS_0888]MDQ1129191.1 16S rRNA (guanine1207-N2)-methyltransferase [Microbacterium sp. SORGH_AS_0888]